MNASFMYHNLGIREQECTREEYQGGRTILHIRTKKKHICCPRCGSKHVISSGHTVREIRSVPIGTRQIILKMDVQISSSQKATSVKSKKANPTDKQVASSILVA